MRRLNSSVKVNFISEKGVASINRTYFAYVPLENMACYVVAESYDNDNDINSARLAVESVLVAFERNPSFRSIKRYIQYAHDQITANSVKSKLEVAIAVVVSDYTRIRFASCGNIKFYLLCDNAFYFNSETQTYYQFSARKYGVDKAALPENKNLLQYLGQKIRPRPYVSKKIELPEESTMLFSTCNLWERVDDVEILDAYEEADSEKLLSDIQELYLFTQLKNPIIGSYTLASIFTEKTFKEDTARKEKRRSMIIFAAVILVIAAIITAVIILVMRSVDRRAIAEIEILSNEGRRYSNYGNYPMAYEQYDKASGLTAKLKNNWQYTKAKKTLTSIIAERWHLYNSIINGDKYLEDGNYYNALKSYQDAINAYHEVYKDAEIHSELLVPEILSGKLERVEKYIAADDLIKTGEAYEIEELYQESLECYKEAEDIVKSMSDLTLRKDLLTRIFEVDRKMNSAVEVNFIRQVEALMRRAETDLNFELALQYSEFIINIYKDLGITDEQSQEDKIRIERKIELDSDASDYIRWAKEAETDSRYNDAVRDYETALKLYGEMEMNVGHERYRNVVDEIVWINNMIEEAGAQEDEAGTGAESGDGQEAKESERAHSFIDLDDKRGAGGF